MPKYDQPAVEWSRMRTDADINGPAPGRHRTSREMVEACDEPASGRRHNCDQGKGDRPHEVPHDRIVPLPRRSDGVGSSGTGLQVDRRRRANRWTARPGPLIHRDQAASGDKLRKVGDFLADRMLPYPVTSQPQASFCGSDTTRLRRDARTFVAETQGVGPGVSTIFAGSGATAGIDRIDMHFCLDQQQSIILLWRETGAEVNEIVEAPGRRAVFRPSGHGAVQGATTMRWGRFRAYPTSPETPLTQMPSTRGSEPPARWWFGAGGVGLCLCAPAAGT